MEAQAAFGMGTKMDVDPAKVPEPHRLSPATDPGAIPTLDGWIENLMSCKQLSEGDVSRLCDRVSLVLAPHSDQD